jgi:hypothetical protein
LKCENEHPTHGKFEIPNFAEASDKQLVIRFYYILKHRKSMSVTARLSLPPPEKGCACTENGLRIKTICPRRPRSCKYSGHGKLKNWLEKTKSTGSHGPRSFRTYVPTYSPNQQTKEEITSESSPRNELGGISGGSNRSRCWLVDLMPTQ